MDDKSIMENLLNLEKGACDLYMHGSLESATPNVHSAFNSVLEDSLAMQNSIYNTMADKGWFPSEAVEATKIQKVNTKFAEK